MKISPILAGNFYLLAPLHEFVEHAAAKLERQLGVEEVNIHISLVPYFQNLNI